MPLRPFPVEAFYLTLFVLIALAFRCRDFADLESRLDRETRTVVEDGPCSIGMAFLAHDFSHV